VGVCVCEGGESVFVFGCVSVCESGGGCVKLLCACVCVCVREREKDSERDREEER